MSHRRPYLFNIPRFIVGPKLPICPMCTKSIALETSKTDEYGKAIHEECYLLKIALHDGTLPPKDS